MKIYRKLKNYIDVDDSLGLTCIRTIFGDLMSPQCVYCFTDEKTGEWKECRYEGGRYRGEMDFLLNYYVVSVTPIYRIKDDKIIPLLRIMLKKEEPK